MTILPGREDAWSGASDVELDFSYSANVLALHNAASARFAPAGVMLPWPVLSKAVTDALYSRYLELVPAGALPWPCEPHSAALVEVRLPIAEALHGAAPNSVGGG